MNTVHCIVWSDSKQAWMVAHEAAKTKGKPGASRGGTAASALMTLLLTAGMAVHAAPPIVVPAVNALPTGGQVVAGQATIGQSGSRMDVNQTTNKAILNWNSFSIGSGAQVNFNQPNSNSVALNRVLGSDPSAIYGSLTANGQVFLVNPNGVLFGRGARVDVGGLVASSMGISNADFMNGNNRFTRDGSTASVVNEGNMYAKYVALLAPEVRNSGLISATLGSVAMAAGDAVTLNISGQNLVDVQVDAATIATLVENRQLIQADDGTVILSAQAASGLMSRVVNSGAIEANGITQHGGTIYLSAGQEVSQTGSLSANAGTLGDGGRITVLASLANPSSLTLADGSISAQGGALGGRGGQVETSASHLQIADSLRVNTSAAHGPSGNWLLDPNDFTIAASGGNATGSSIASNLLTTDVTIATASQGTAGGNGDIFVNDNIAVGGSSAGHSLTLQAQRNIVVQAGKAITDAAANPIGVNLQSGGATVFLDNVGASSAVTAVNIHGNLNIGGLNCAPGSTCYANGNAVYAMGAYVGQYASLNTNGADINIAGKAFTGSGSGSLGGPTSNLPLGVIGGTYSSLHGRNISLYGESASNAGIQVNYGDPCNTPANCTVGTTLNASNQITVIGKATSGNNSGLSINGSTWTAPTISLSGIGSGTSAGLSLNGVGYGTPTFNASTALNWIADKLAISNTTLGAAGALSIKPYGTSFSTPFAWPSSGLNLTTTLSGLTLGKAGNTASISMSGVQTVNGDINLLADGAGGNVTLASGTQLRAALGGNIAVAAGANFVNNAGGNALATSGGGRWLVYSSAVGADTFGGLASGNLAVWNKTYASYLPGSVAETGNRYLFANQPVLTVTAANATKTYGQVLSLGAPVAGVNYTISGLVNAATYGGVFSQDSTSGAPSLASSGTSASAPVIGSPYTITSSAGSFLAPVGYGGVNYVSGSLSVSPAPLTVTASNATKTYGQTPTLSGFSSSGLQNGETIGSVTEASAGAAAAAGVANSPYVITPSAATGGTFTPANYTITYANGSLAVSPAPLTVTANSATKTYDGVAYSGGNGVTFSGFVNNETASVLGGTLAYRGASQGAVNAGNYLIAPTGLTSSNYTITPAAGTLAVSKATLTATADDKSRLYGDVNPSLTVSYSGFKNGDTIAVIDIAPVASTAATATSNEGSYAIALAGGTDNNYELSLVSGKMLVNPLPTLATPGAINLAVYLSAQLNSAQPSVVTPADNLLNIVISGPDDRKLGGSNYIQDVSGFHTSMQSSSNNYSIGPSEQQSLANTVISVPDDGNFVANSALSTSAASPAVSGFGDSYTVSTISNAPSNSVLLVSTPEKATDAPNLNISAEINLRPSEKQSATPLGLVTLFKNKVSILGLGDQFGKTLDLSKATASEKTNFLTNVKGNFTALQLRTVGFTAADMRAARYKLDELKLAGYSATELKLAGYSVQDMKNANFSRDELLNAGFAKDLVANVYK